MEDQEFYQEEFIVMLTIDGTSYDEIEVKVTDPNKTIRDQINRDHWGRFQLITKNHGGRFFTILCIA